MEAQVDPDAAVSDADVRRVVQGIRDGKTRSAVFPNLSGVSTAVQGSGVSVEVRFVKREGMPVQLVTDDDEVDTAAVRMVPLQKKFHLGAFDLADKVGLTRPKATALREHLGIDANPDCTYTFTFGSQKHPRYSDNAFVKMRDALAGGVDMGAVWAAHGAGHRRAPRPVCSQPDCHFPGAS